MSGTSPASTEPLLSANISDRKSTKRKIDDALYNLDQALRSSDDIQKPPAKKSRFPGSLYSTLAKYGIKPSRSSSSSDTKSDEINIIKKSAPHLSAILSRAASKKEKTAHREELARATVTSLSAATSQPPTTLEYRPSSTTSFLNRLSTFKLSTFSTKPSQIDAVAASKAGWVNEGKERLLCGICKASWILASRDGMTREAGNALVEKQKTYLVQMHKDGCPWKAQQCDDSIYCIPLKAPTALAKEIKSNSLEIDNKKVLEGVSIRHPLASSQVQALLSALSSVETSPHVPSTSEKSAPTSEDAAPQQETAQTEPSQTAALIAVFGWSLVPPIVEPRLVTPSITRSSSTSIAHAPAMSNATRRTSWNPSSSISEAGSPLKPSRIPLPRTATSITTRLQRQDTPGPKRDESLIHCTLCQRRVGLWTFKSSEEPSATPTTSTTPTTPIASGSTTSNPNDNTPESVTSPPSRLPVRRPSQMPTAKRQFDLLKEHRSYCPYVVRSTSVPTLSALSTPPSPSGARSASANHSPSNSHPPRPAPSRTSSASSFNFSFSPSRNAPTYPGAGTGGALGDPSVVEGWRAVLAMVMRTGLGKRQRHRALMNVQGVDMRPSSAGTIGDGSRGSSGSSPVTPSVGAEHEQTDDGVDVEMDGIQAMVQEVKSRGGKDLLRYVKSLFA